MSLEGTKRSQSSSSLSEKEGFQRLKFIKYKIQGITTPPEKQASKIGRKWGDLGLLFIVMLTKCNVLLVCFALLVLGTISFPKKNRTSLVYNYADHLKATHCVDTSILSPQQIISFRNTRQWLTPITLNLDNIAAGKSPFSYITLKLQFFLFLIVNLSCLIVLCINIRRLNRYTKFFVKFKLEWQTSHHFSKGLMYVVLAVLLYISYNCFTGLEIGGKMEKGLTGLICGVISFPNNFSRGSNNNELAKFSSLNDYQTEMTNLRLLFDNLKRNYSEQQKWHESIDFKNSSIKYESVFTKNQDKAVMNSIIKAIDLTKTLKDEAKFMGASLNYLRELMYWLKGGLMFVEGYIDSTYRLQKIPQLISSIAKETYIVLLTTTVAVFFSFVFLSVKSTSNDGIILKSITFVLSFSALLCLVFSSIGQMNLIVPSQLCNILSSYPNKAVVVDKVTTHVRFYEQSVRSTLLQLLERSSHQSDGNMAYMSPQIYRHITEMKDQLEKVYSFQYNQIETVLAEQLPKQQQNIKTYFTFIPVFLSRLKEISPLLDSIQKSVKEDGDFGRLTLRPFGEYIETIQHSLCDANLSIWYSNVELLFICGVLFNGILLLLAVFLRIKLNGYSLNANDQEDVQLNTFSTQRIGQN